MENEKRLIDANALEQHCKNTKIIGLFPEWKDFPYAMKIALIRYGKAWKEIIQNTTTVDAVPVDEIRVDIMSLSLENQEAVLNVSICGKPNEVKIPFSKEVAEVVHGRWKYGTRAAVCSECGFERNLDDNFGAAIACPNCSSKMDGDGK